MLLVLKTIFCFLYFLINVLKTILFNSKSQ